MSTTAGSEASGPTKIIRCPRCKNPRSIRIDEIRSDQFCKNDLDGAPCDYPLFFIMQADTALSDADGDSTRYPADRPAPPEVLPPPPPPRPAPGPIIERTPTAWRPPYPTVKRPRYWRLWPFVVIVAVVDVVLLYFLIQRLF